MRIALIVAVSHDRAIGRDGDLPWRLPADLRRFKRLTLGKPILMGRATHASIGRALPGRLNLVLSRDPHYTPATGAHHVASTCEALERARDEDPEELVVIGGAGVYEAFLPRAHRLYLTVVHTTVPDGDTRFPPLPLDAFHITRSEHITPPPAPEGATPRLRHSFHILERDPDAEPWPEPDASPRLDPRLCAFDPEG